MSFSTNRNVDKYYDETEPEKHWELRKQFMVVNKDKYPEDYLVALAKTFSNIEFMGCRWVVEHGARWHGRLLQLPGRAATGQLICGMSQELARAYREDKKTKAQRTFVSASTAAENKGIVGVQSKVQVIISFNKEAK